MYFSKDLFCLLTLLLEKHREETEKRDYEVFFFKSAGSFPNDYTTVLCAYCRMHVTGHL